MRRGRARRRAITRSTTTERRSRSCSSNCFSTRIKKRRARSCSTSTRPTIRCTAIRRAASFTATTTATATCRFTCFAAGICLRRSSGAPTSTGAPGRLRRWSASWLRSESAGRSVLRADSGFAREALMAWCEANKVDYVFGLARNPRLQARIAEALADAERLSLARQGKPARVFRDFLWSTKESWSRRRRVIAKAEWTGGEANPRFLVTSLRPDTWLARALYEDLYCARGEMENRIKECQGDLFADRTSAATMRANQLRLWFSSMAYVLICALRRIGLAHTQFAAATCATIRLKLLKLGALVTISARRVRIAFASACPWANEWRIVQARLAHARGSPA